MEREDKIIFTVKKLSSVQKGYYNHLPVCGLDLMVALKICPRLVICDGNVYGVECDQDEEGGQ